MDIVPLVVGKFVPFPVFIMTNLSDVDATLAEDGLTSAIDCAGSALAAGGIRRKGGGDDGTDSVDDDIQGNVIRHDTAGDNDGDDSRHRAGDLERKSVAQENDGLRCSSESSLRSHGTNGRAEMVFYIGAQTTFYCKTREQK